MIGHSTLSAIPGAWDHFGGCGVAAGAFGAHALKEISGYAYAPSVRNRNKVCDVSCLWTLYRFWAIDRYPGQALENQDGSFFSGFSSFRQSVRGVSCGHPVDGAVTPIVGWRSWQAGILLAWGVSREALPRATR